MRSRDENSLETKVGRGKLNNKKNVMGIWTDLQMSESPYMINLKSVK